MCTKYCQEISEGGKIFSSLNPSSERLQMRVQIFEFNEQIFGLYTIYLDSTQFYKYTYIPQDNCTLPDRIWRGHHHIVIPKISAEF